MTIKLKPLIISFLVALGGGGIVAFLTRNSMSIYDEINTPKYKVAFRIIFKKCRCSRHFNINKINTPTTVPIRAVRL